MSRILVESLLTEWKDNRPTTAWYGLGEGETFEDMIFSSLTEYGEISCPDCGEAVQVSEESLGRMAMEMLARW